MFDRKKILLIDPEYYMENANTLIIDRICRLLSKVFEVTIATYCSQCSREFESNSDIHIQTVPYYSLLGSVNGGKRQIIDFIIMGYYALKRHIKNDYYGEKDARYFIRLIERQIEISEYDVIISFSSPFISHYIASVLSKKHNIPWIAYYFDPFFSNYTLDRKLIDKRKKIEENIMSKAEKVLITYPTNIDYIKRNVCFESNIIQTEMPGIRKDMFFLYERMKHKRYICYFVGNLYSDIRNPKNVIKLFEALKDDAELFFVGGYYGNELSIDDVANNIHFVGKKNGEDLQKVFQEADFLVNIGNSITNQMPSKIFEYISTGKPIINFFKNDNCPTLQYTSKYTLAINIDEREIEESIEKVRMSVLSFCRENIGKRVVEEEINNTFHRNTDKFVTDTLVRVIEEVIGE